MAYATTSDVQAIITTDRFTIDGSSTPTSTQVSNWLDQLSARVDAALTAARYGTVPATGSSDLNLLKLPVAEAAARLAYRVHYSNDLLAVSQDEAFNQFLTDLREWNIELIDQSPSKGFGVMQAKVYGVD